MTCAILSEKYTRATIAYEAQYRIDSRHPTFPIEGYPFDMHAAAPHHIMRHDVPLNIEVVGGQRVHWPCFPKAVVLAPPPEAARI